MKKHIKNSRKHLIAKTATEVAPSTAFIKGPAIIGENAEIRHCAFIRGKVIIEKELWLEIQQK